MRFREFAQLLFELNMATQRRAIARFKAENPQLTDDEIALMLDKWERYIDRMPADVRDINTVSWQQLATAVDDVEAMANLERTRGQPDPADLEPIYDNDNLVIYRGDSKPKCIHYGQGHSWCISRTDASNLFNNYRYDEPEPMFYFVFDRDQDPEYDEWHAVVIHVSRDGEFTVTTSFNDDGDQPISWDRLVRHHPKLANLKHVFQPQPLTDREREDYYRFRQPMSTEEFDNLAVREKIRAIEFGMQLDDEQQALLPYPLLKLYLVNNISFLSPSSWLRLKPGDFRYALRKVFDLWDDEESDHSNLEYLPDYFDPAYNDQHRQAILHQFVTGPDAFSGSAMFYLEKMAEQRDSEGLDRWPAAEHVIATSMYTARDYAQKALKGRWPEPHRDTAEKTMARDPFVAVEYAQVLGGRWPEPHRDMAEANMAHGYTYDMQFLETHTALLYARVLGGRWPEPHRDIAEKNIVEQGPRAIREYSQIISIQHNTSASMGQ